MKRLTAWILVLLMLVQNSVSFGMSAEEKQTDNLSVAEKQAELLTDGEEQKESPTNAEEQTENAGGEIFVQIPRSQYHIVTFTADGEEVATIFVADGTSIQTLPAAPEVGGVAFLGWYDGNTPFSAEETIFSDRQLRAVYREVRQDLEEKKRNADFRYEDVGQYASVEIYGTHNKN